MRLSRYLPTGFFFLSALAGDCGGPTPEKADPQQPTAQKHYLAYFGTYTRGENAAKGIYFSRFEADSGRMSEVSLAVEASDPSFLAVHPNNNTLYSVNELAGQPGTVSAYAIEPATGRLRLLNRAPAQGRGSCYVSLDASGSMLAVANYVSGTVASFRVLGDGRLGEAVSVIQHRGAEAPHPHSVNFSPDDRFLIVPDVGTHKVHLYRADPGRAALQPHQPAEVPARPGSGPRHLAFHPSGRYCYVIEESGNGVMALKWHETRGTLEEFQRVPTLPATFWGESYTAEVIAHPSGKFLYGSNRGHDSIAVFSIEQHSGRLTAVDHTPTQGKYPRNFNLDPSGKWLFALNRESNTVVTFAVDQETGKLTPTGQVLELLSPSCLRWVPLG